MAGTKPDPNTYLLSGYLNEQKNTLLNWESEYPNSGYISTTKELGNIEQAHKFPEPHFPHTDVHSGDPKWAPS